MPCITFECDCCQKRQVTDYHICATRQAESDFKKLGWIISNNIHICPKCALIMMRENDLEKKNHIVDANEMVWHPIETVPEDDTFLVYFPLDDDVDIYSSWGLNNYLSVNTKSHPTHWMPIKRPNECLNKNFKLPLHSFEDAKPVRCEFLGEQTILTYNAITGTWDISFFEGGWTFNQHWYGATHWLDITNMHPPCVYKKEMKG